MSLLSTAARIVLPVLFLRVRLSLILSHERCSLEFSLYFGCSVTLLKAHMPHDKVSSRYFILTFSSYKLPLDFIRESREELTLVCTDCGDRAQAGPQKSFIGDVGMADHEKGRKQRVATVATVALATSLFSEI